MGYRLGVDLGTTWTAAGALDGSEITPVELGARGPAFPSVIAFDGETVLLGEAAVRNLIADPASGAREIKRRLGDTTPFVLKGTPYTAEALMGRILAHVVGVASLTHGAPPDVVALTHPATWGEFKLDLLREAGRVAGLAEVELVAEPSAAAAHYARAGKVANDGLVAVYDFGGGTFDAAVLQGKEGNFEIVGKAEGLDRLGGVDLDQAVIAHVDQALDGALRELDRESPDVREALGELREACVVAKEALSSETEVTIPVAVPGLNTEVRLTRAEFESAIRPRLDETIDAFERAITAAGVEMTSLDVVLLVGGSSRIPLVAEVLAARTGRPIALDTDTKAAVSLGAAGWGSGVGATVAPAAAVTADLAGAAAGAAAGSGATVPSSRREPRAARGDDAAKESRGLGRTAKVVAGGAAAAVVAGGGAAAYAATGGEFGLPPTGGGTDAEDRAEQADGQGGEDKGVPAKPGGFDRASGDDESLDAFDDLAAPAGGASGGHVGGGGSSPGGGDPTPGGAARSSAQRGDALAAASARAVDAPDGAGASSAPLSMRDSRPEAMGGLHETDPAGTAHESEATGGMGSPARVPSTPEAPAGPTEDEQVEMIKANLRARLEAWNPPAGADAAEVEALKSELEGRIDRFDPADGVAFENAAGDLQQALDDSLEDFQQDQQIDKTQEATQALIEEEQREAAERAEEIEDKNGFIEYQGALSSFVQNYKPNFYPWVDEREMAALKGRLLADISQAPFDPDRDLRMQQMTLERAMRSQLETFNRNQHVARYEAEVARIESARWAALAVRDDATRPPQERSDAAGELDTLETQLELVNNLMTDIRDGYGNPDPAAEAALHAHLEPEPIDVYDDVLAVSDLTTTASVFAAAADLGGDAAVEDTSMLSAMVTDHATAFEANPLARSALVDAFDEVAEPVMPAMTTMSTTSTAPDEPHLSSESQMTGNGPPLPPGIQTMAAPDTPAPSPTDPMDDALGIPVAATPMAPPAPVPTTPAPPPAGENLAMPGASGDVDEFATPAPAMPEPVELPEVEIPDAMPSPLDDLPEDDSPNPLDDPLDPM